jgi:hypothetical protein
MGHREQHTFEYYEMLGVDGERYVGGIIIPAKGPAGSAVQLLILDLIAATAITAAIKKTRK